MKLFVLTSRIPYPLEKGDKLRAFHQLKGLSKTHRIYLCSIKMPLTNIPKETKDVLLEFCEEIHFIKLSYTQIFLNIFKAVFNKDPFQSALFYDINAQNKINKLILNIKPDHIYCQLTRVAKYIIDQKITKTLDYMDAFSKGMERRANKSNLLLRWFYQWESKKQKKYESYLMNVFNYHTIITKEDRSYIKHPKQQKINIITNGVNFDYFKPFDSIKKYDLVFVGNMGYAPNIDAVKFLCNYILPIVKLNIPEVKVLIAGADPSRSVINLQSENVTVSGWIDDIREAYAMSKIFIAPMRMGTGLQNKLLEAMAMNKACVTTDIVNKALLAPQDVICTANSSKELAKLCTDLLKNSKYRNELGEKARIFVKNKYSWEKTTSQLNKLLMH
ncbi:MAG: hypothetical protein CMP57_00020 [Flavobacteriales bacterium]|nr:hypothetical protein [Flavobacteriales bacterium]|tara:strand:+ start:3189 stop:4352 length:1164 start_codon:yes stop_codon:yes gene_type:complete